jgi:hypothetical protein
MSLGQFQQAVQNLIDDDIPEQFPEPNNVADLSFTKHIVLCSSANGVVSLIGQSFLVGQSIDMLDEDFHDFLRRLAFQGPETPGYFQMNKFLLTWTSRTHYWVSDLSLAL